MNLENGWIKIYRSLLDWEWFKNSNMVHLYIYLIMKANSKDGRYQGVDLKRGQLLTGINAISAKTGISLQSLRTCIKRLKSTNEITVKSTNKYSIITICKYEDYQEAKIETNNQINKQTNNQLTFNQQTTNNKQEYKNTRIQEKDIYAQAREKYKNNKVDENSHALRKLIKKDYPRISQLKEQLTEDEALKIAMTYDKDDIIYMLGQMERYERLFEKKRKNVNSTLVNWLEKDKRDRDVLKRSS